MKSALQFNFKHIFVIFLLVGALGCNKEEINYDAPYVRIDKQTLTEPQDGGYATFKVESNRPWTIQITQKDGDENWVMVEPMKGEGNAEIKLTFTANSGTQREATLKIATETVYEYLKVVQQGGVASTEIYNMTFGTSGATSSPYAYVSDYSDWGATGTGYVSTTMQFIGDGASLRTPSKASAEYTGASGSTSLFFGAGSAGNATFQIQKIATAGASNFILKFGATRYKMGDPDANTFYVDRMKVYVSGDGTQWTPVVYTFAAGEIWGQATGTASLPAASDYLYVKYETTEASTMRIDDISITATGSSDITLNVETTAATAITETGATVGGMYVAPTDSIVTEVGVEYKTASSEYTAVKASAVANPFSVQLTGLTTNTPYTYRAYIKTAQATHYGTEMVFTPEAVAPKQYITVAALRDMSDTIKGNLFLKASMISDQLGGNSTSKKNIVISDGAAGIAIRLAANAADLPVGTELELSLNGAVLAQYQGLLQLNNFSNDSMRATGATKIIAAKSITSNDLLTGNYESMLVAVGDVEVVAADLSKTMVVNGAHTSINMESKTGDTFLMFTSSYSTFKDAQVPQGSGILNGIASINIPTGSSTPLYQVLPQTAADFANMTNARFGAAPVFSYGTPLQAGALVVDVALDASNTITLPYSNATVGDAYSLTLTPTGAGAAGMTPITETGTYASNGTVVFQLEGTPSTTGAVVFTITGTNITTPITLDGTVSAATAGSYSLASWSFTAAPTLPIAATTTDGVSSATLDLTGFAITPAINYTASSKTIYANSWEVNNAWFFTFNPTQTITSGKTLEVNFKAYGTKTAPQNWMVEYSTDNTTWNAVGAALVYTTSSQAFTRTVVLPQDVSGVLYVRIRDVDNLAISADGSTVAPAGNARLAEVSVNIVN